MQAGSLICSGIPIPPWPPEVPLRQTNSALHAIPINNSISWKAVPVMHLGPGPCIQQATAENFLKYISPDSALQVESGFFYAMGILMAVARTDNLMLEFDKFRQIVDWVFSLIFLVLTWFYWIFSCGWWNHAFAGPWGYTMYMFQDMGRSSTVSSTWQITMRKK